MEARLILATVAQRCRFLMEPNQHVVPMQLVTVRPKGGIRMKVQVRAPM
jgi:cytochrome P450